VLLALALALGALALGGPALERAPAGRLWTTVVDRGPGMGLAVDGRGGARRLDVALAELEALFDDAVRAGDRVRWTSPGLEPVELGAGEPPPGAFLRVERSSALRPAWVWYDVPGAVWVTDRPPAVVPERAGVARSGGEAAPGLAAADRRALFAWNGAELVPAGEATREVRVDPGLPEPLRRFAATWMAAGGHALAPGAGAPAELSIEAVAGEATRAVRVARDGFALEGRAAATGAVPSGAEAGWTTWLAADEGLPLVASRPGRVSVALLELEEPRGDPAAFAVAWGRLFDSALLPPVGLVPVADRAAAGERSRRAPLEPPPPLAASAPPAPLDALLALCAAAVGLLAAWRLARA
jgi:hypothetical protein